MHIGAVDETRTRDLHLGKVALYQLSYYRMLERVMGIEPTYPAWKAGALPLSYTRARKAVDETRTRDLHLGKVALYQLSYYRMALSSVEYNTTRGRGNQADSLFFTYSSKFRIRRSDAPADGLRQFSSAAAIARSG